ncbi:MAG: hypothetical protein ACRDIV_03660 [Ktedonobacteraceae bacterium]
MAQVIRATVDPRVLVNGQDSRFFSGYVLLPGGGSPENNLTVDITGMGKVSDLASIYLQTQQFQNSDLNYTDEFALQVISVDQQVPQTTIRVRVRRVDQDSGWAQQLRISILVIDPMRTS